MAEEKRYYWIKLKTDFFDLETIDWLKSQDNGCEYIVLYQQLCLMTANKDGEMAMQIGEMLVPYDAKKIARDTKTDIDTVIVALKLFSQIGLIYKQENGIFRIPAVTEMVGSECDSAQRVRKHREKQKSLQSNSNVTETMLPSNESALPSNEELEFRVKSLDKEIEIEREIDSSSSLTVQEVGISTGDKVKTLINKYWKRDLVFDDALQYLPKVLTDGAEDPNKMQMLEIALKLSVQRGEKACNWNYVNAIYKGWAERGITTPEEWAVYEKQRKGGV